MSRSRLPIIETRGDSSCLQVTQYPVQCRDVCKSLSRDTSHGVYGILATDMIAAQSVRSEQPQTVSAARRGADPLQRGFAAPMMSSTIKIIPLLVVLLAASASASSCVPGEWAFQDSCQLCGEGMISPANSLSQDACTCKSGYVMTASSADEQQ